MKEIFADGKENGFLLQAERAVFAKLIIQSP
jgi:hypothetical protein